MDLRIEGKFEFVVGKKRFRVGAGESVFMSALSSHVEGTANGKPGKVL